MPKGVYDHSAIAYPAGCDCGHCRVCHQREGRHWMTELSEHLRAQEIFRDTGAVWFLDENVLQSQLKPSRFGADF